MRFINIAVSGRRGESNSCRLRREQFECGWGRGGAVFRSARLCPHGKGSPGGSAAVRNIATAAELGPWMEAEPGLCWHRHRHENGSLALELQGLRRNPELFAVEFVRLLIEASRRLAASLTSIDIEHAALPFNSHFFYLYRWMNCGSRSQGPPGSIYRVFDTDLCQLITRSLRRHLSAIVGADVFRQAPARV